VAQAAECLPSKCTALSSTPTKTKQTKNSQHSKARNKNSNSKMGKGLCQILHQKRHTDGRKEGQEKAQCKHNEAPHHTCQLRQEAETMPMSTSGHRNPGLYWKVSNLVQSSPNMLTTGWF
jgi:hypothetical protein